VLSWRRMPTRPLPALAALASLALACNTVNDTPVVKHGYQGQPPLGDPITVDEAPVGQWSWIPFPDTTCADGSPSGLGVNRGEGQDLVVFFDGGGACWDYFTCVSVGTAVDASYGEAKFWDEVDVWLPRSLLDRAQLPPTLEGATLVFVPYCTADVHGGDRTVTYSGYAGADTKTWHHEGHANLMAFLPRLAATWAAPRKVVVACSSAGGFGALASYEAFRWYWKDAQAYLVDDSGPPLVGDDIPATERNAWYQSWNLGASLDLFCVDCREDFSAGIAALSHAYRDDRFALLSNDQDSTMSMFLGGKLPGTFQDDLSTLRAGVFEPTANARVYYDSGAGHMLLPDVAAHSTGGVALRDWLETMVSDAPGWESAVP
jgi:hypothetical protein